MLPIIWHPSARNDLREILRFIAAHNLDAARRLRERIEMAVLPAASHPLIFRPGRVPGTREIIAHPNYIIIYRVTELAIEVLSVIHSRQQYPA